MLNLKIIKGATFRKNLYLKNKDKTPADLTGFRAKFVISNALQDLLVLDDTTTPSKVYALDNTGNIQVYIPHTVTTTISYTQARYKLFLYEPNGDVRLLLEGNINVE